MGKNILIVGASGEIGSAIAEMLIEKGYQLILHYNQSKESIHELQKKVQEESILSVLQADLTNEAEIESFLSRIVFPVDGIIFAGGTAHYGLFQHITVQEMDDLLHLHVQAPWRITRHLLPDMLQRERGKIIFITSIWGDKGASNEVIYSSVKGAQNSFVKALAKEVAASGIAVNAISPGFIEIKMNRHFEEAEKKALIAEIPANRPGKPSDIAHAAAFLLGEDAGYIHGEILHIDGGW